MLSLLGVRVRIRGLSHLQRSRLIKIHIRTDTTLVAQPLQCLSTDLVLRRNYCADLDRLPSFEVDCVTKMEVRVDVVGQVDAVGLKKIYISVTKNTIRLLVQRSIS